MPASVRPGISWLGLPRTAPAGHLSAAPPPAYSHVVSFGMGAQPELCEIATGGEKSLCMLNYKTHALNASRRFRYGYADGS